MNEHSGREQFHWVGADVSKAAFDVALVRANQHYPDTPLRDVPAHKFMRSREGVTQFLSWLDAFGLERDEVRIVMEATGRFSSELAVWLLDVRPSLRPAIAPPTHTSAFIDSMAVRNKTDRVEARALGFYGVERQPIPYEPLTPERAELRELSRWRDYLVRDRTRLKNKVQESSESSVVTSMRNKRLRLLSADIKRIEESMHKLVEQDEGLKTDIELLCTIHGIAFISATTIVTELGDLRRFQRARQLTAFSGMSPKHHQSGSSIRGKSRLCKQGNPRVRQSLYLCAMIAIRGDNQFRKTYQGLLAQGKAKMVALAAVMRKLLVLMRAILISGKPYSPVGITRT